ncbi:hypothetical protein M3Y94_01262100 [Aphelenchoides besseyi]|nr:hypothetical protein M3Y94_01262100 [Aphelenchoides besseyi]
MFFRHFIKVVEPESLSTEQRTFRVMMFSNNFCLAAKELLLYSKVEVFLALAGIELPNQWIFKGFSEARLNEPTLLRYSKVHVLIRSAKSEDSNNLIFGGFSEILLNEPAALAVFKLIVPEIKSFAVYKIDPAILLYLSGISKYGLRGENDCPKYSIELLEEFSFGGKLKMLECNRDFWTI